MKITAIIPCAGQGVRAGFDRNKLLEKTGEITVIEKTVNNFLDNSRIDEIILVTSEKDYKVIKDLFFRKENIKFVMGGSTRTESVKNALCHVDDGIVIIHDGARPFVTQKIINDCIDTAIKYGTAVTAITPTDTIAKLNENGEIVTAGRQGLLAIQTPQAFDVIKLKTAYSKITENDVFTDDSGIYAKYVAPCKTVQGSIDNVKLTYKKDFDNMAELVGTGFDLHRLVEGRKLILGGIEIPHDKGLLGHSDADVLTHAIMDAILSACHMRDIGYHFSDKDEKYKDISSMILLDKVMQMITSAGYKVNNVSAVIMAEKPKLSTFVDKLSTNLAEFIHISPKMVGITCTTLEGIGIVGREEGIAVQAYCSVVKAE